MQRMLITMSCVASSSSTFPTNNSEVVFQGEMALKCFQDLQNGKPTVDRTDNLVVCGVQRRPFNLKLDRNVSFSELDLSHLLRKNPILRLNFLRL